jgi:hypothetical protein
VFDDVAQMRTGLIGEGWRRRGLMCRHQSQSLIEKLPVEVQQSSGIALQRKGGVSGWAEGHGVGRCGQ